jgi:hypothetical protein
MKITGVIRTVHQAPACVAEAVAADNLREMETRAEDGTPEGVVITTITSTKIRSVIASMDDYLANITVAEELCRKKLISADQETGCEDQHDNPNTQE